VASKPSRKTRFVIGRSAWPSNALAQLRATPILGGAGALRKSPVRCSDS
jgi:hypothetical protein